MMVHVAQRHIDGGQRQHHLRNPIALAIQEIDQHAVVTYHKIHRICGVEYLPYHIRLWLQAFNAGRKVEPVTFTLY